MARILIVADNPVIRSLLSRALASRRHEVLVAEDAADASRQANRKRPDLILLDMSLPAPGADVVAERLKGSRRTKRTPIMALTVDARPAARRAALDAGCDDSIPKPIHLPELQARLEQLLNPAIKRVA